MKVYTGDSTIERAENLIDTPTQTVTHLVLRKGQEIPTHQVSFSAIVVPIKGRVTFTGPTESVELAPGKIVQLTPGESHSLTGLEDAELMVVKMVLAD